MAQLAKMASVCRFCGSSVAYSYHRVALFGKKTSQERLASRISALLDITLNDDDGLPNLMCSKCKRRVESLENHTQWRSYTRAHTGPGPGEFLSALVNYARSTYLNRNSVAVYRIMSCRIKLPMPLRPGKL